MVAPLIFFYPGTRFPSCRRVVCILLFSVHIITSPFYWISTYSVLFLLVLNISHLPLPFRYVLHHMHSHSSTIHYQLVTSTSNPIM